MFEDRTPENLKREALAKIEAATGLSAMDGSFADAMVGPLAEKMGELFMALPAVTSMVFVDESSGGYTEQFPGDEPVTTTTGVPTLEEAQAIADCHGGEITELNSSAYEWMDGMELPDVPEPYDEAVRIFEQGEAAYREGQTEADDVMAMLVDQEYRLTLLEMEAK